MKVGVDIIHQNLGRPQPDHEVYREEQRLADLVEPLGFDSLWSVEHHFDDYTMVPDVLQYLTFMAARTTRIQLGSAVVVLPWHDPVRVAEQIAMLDIQSGGRLLLGFGRGAAQIEYDGFRVAMDTSRARFTEAAEVVTKALMNERFSHTGDFFQIPEMSIRPQPATDFTGRMYGAAISPESAEMMARLGFGVLVIPQRDWDTTAEELDRYNAICRNLGQEPVKPIVGCFVYVDDTEAKAMDGARKYMGAYWQSADEHYRFSHGAHAGVKGYEYYDKMGQASKKMGPQAVNDYFISFQCVGTPEMCLEKIEFIRSKVDTEHFIGIFKYGGMPIQRAEENLRRFAADVMPGLHREDFRVHAEPVVAVAD